jgi:hypothetical protein
MSVKVIRELTHVLETSGIKGIEILEFKNCQIGCTCTQESEESCPVK